MILTRTPTPDVISITVGLSVNSSFFTLIMASYTKIPVSTQMMSTDNNAPITSKDER